MSTIHTILAGPASEVKAADPGKMVEVDPDTLSGDALNWAAFTALFTPAEPTLIKLKRSVVKGVTFPGGLYLTYSNGHESIIWEPDRNAEQAEKLIEGFLIGSRKHGALWYAMASDDMGGVERVSWSKTTCKGGTRYGTQSFEVRKRQQRFDDPSRLIASLRAAVAYNAYRTGTPVTVPALLKGKRANRKPIP